MTQYAGATLTQIHVPNTYQQTTTHKQTITTNASNVHKQYALVRTLLSGNISTFMMSARSTRALSLLMVVVAATTVTAKFNGQDMPDTGEPGGVIVHLADWMYGDIATECETFLSKKGYAGVQVSPITEYLEPSRVNPFWKIFETRPWYDRHQVASYLIDNPSGDEAEFKNMVERCNRAGIKVYVDVVLNHMTMHSAGEQKGCAGSNVDTEKMEYPQVPYTKQDFNQPSCIAYDFSEPTTLRNCDFRQLHDLNQTNPCVREKMRTLLNKLISFGVAGFRVSFAKFMWPADLKKLFGRLDYLNCEHGFACDTPPFIYQDFFAKDDYFTTVKPTEYSNIGLVTEYNFANHLSRVLNRYEKPVNVAEIKDAWRLMDSSNSIVFVNTFETKYESNARTFISHSEYKNYKLATVMMMATPYGQPLVTSTYYASKGAPPPYMTNPTYTKKTGAANPPLECGLSWVCEHREDYVVQMIEFRNVVKDEPVTNWWYDKQYQFAFSRGNKGFVFINNSPKSTKNLNVQTGLLAGLYCDVMSGEFDSTKALCYGNKVRVAPDGTATISLLSNSWGFNVLVLHAGAKIA